MAPHFKGVGSTASSLTPATEPPSFLSVSLQKGVVLSCVDGSPIVFSDVFGNFQMGSLEG